MSEEHKDSYKFAPLKADNWSAWKRRVEAIAMQKGLWDHLEGKVARPGYADATKPTDEEEKAIREWDRNDTGLYSLIVVNVSDSEEINLGPSRRGSEVWAQLKSVKESSSGISRLTARRRR
jgi:hypothetical protein